ncbi:MAG: ribosome biogenesis GTP-binding protein YihA/YsxC [Caulobacterales bacterium]
MSDEDDLLEAGRLLFAGPVTFERGVAQLDGLPAADLPEIAFAGRSNVGKSSLVNALTGRKTLARASAEPGRTRELNFFNLGDRLRLVDLPGYGYAKASKTEIARWNAVMRDYLRGRAPLKRVILLIDARHGAKANDLAVMEALDKAAVVYQAVLTKSDKLKAAEVDQRVAETEAVLAKRPAAHPAVIATSSEKGLGIAELRADIAALGAP